MLLSHLALILEICSNNQEQTNIIVTEVKKKENVKFDMPGLKGNG